MAKARRGRRRPGRQPDRSTPVRRDHWRADGQPKSRFATQAEANRWTLQMRLEEGADLDPYPCSFCAGWHVGSRPSGRD
jgi:hypothetical protein